MISYYDIRAACNALRALQNKPLRRRKLDIHYSIPKVCVCQFDSDNFTIVIIMTFVTAAGTLCSLDDVRTIHLKRMLARALW